MQNALNTIKLQKISVHTAQKKKKYQIFPNSKNNKEQSLPPNPPVQIFTLLIPIKKMYKEKSAAVKRFLVKPIRFVLL